MTLIRRAILSISLSLIAGAIGICAERAHSQDASAEAAKLVMVSGPNKPVHKLNEVPTADPVVLLVGKREDPYDGGATAKPDAVEASPVVSRISGAPAAVHPAAETKKKTAEIAWLQKQIPQKMTRITLLMRLFFNDEMAFVIDPLEPTGGRSGPRSTEVCAG